MFCRRKIEDFTKEELEIILQLLEICKDDINDKVDNILKCNIDDLESNEEFNKYFNMLRICGNLRVCILILINRKKFCK